jgi:outer membrane beta-barrel protein
MYYVAFMSAVFLLASVFVVSAPCYAQGLALAATQFSSENNRIDEFSAEENASVRNDSTKRSTDIDPNIQRRDIREFDIDSENVEIGIFAGIISIEDFASSATAGLRLSYHINENMFIEASYAQANAGDTSFEVLSGGLPFLSEEHRDYTYYDISAAYSVNGEVFVTDEWVFNTDFFLILGAGATEFGGDERFTVNAGAGYRILVTDYLSVRFDVRDYVFNSDIIGPEKSVHNLTLTLSTSFFF